MAIDFGAFEQGSRAAKKDYWSDVQNSQQSAIRDVAVQDGLSKLRDAHDAEWAANYVAPMLMDQQRAAAAGMPMDEWYQRAKMSILNDPSIANASPQQQQRVMRHVYDNGVTLADQLAKSGDEQRALELRKSLGVQFGPENRGNTDNVFDSYNMAGAGWVNNRATTGMWNGPNGQSMPADLGALSLLQKGQAGLLDESVATYRMQQELQQGLSRGTHVQAVDANGKPYIRAKYDDELWQENETKQERIRLKQVEDAVARGEFDPNNYEQTVAWAGLIGDPRLVNTAGVYARGPQPSAVGAQPPAGGVSAQTGSLFTNPQQSPINQVAEVINQAPVVTTPAINQLTTEIRDAQAQPGVSSVAAPRPDQRTSGRPVYGFDLPPHDYNFTGLLNQAGQFLESNTPQRAGASPIANMLQPALDPRALPDANMAMRPSDAAYAVDLQAQEIEPYRQGLNDWVAQLNTEGRAPTEEEMLNAQQILRQHPGLEKYYDLMVNLAELGVYK